MINQDSRADNLENKIRYKGSLLIMLAPKIIALDSSTLGNLARDVESVKEADDIVELLNSGKYLLFLTWHHLAELSQHKNESVYKRRWDLIKKLRFLVFLKTNNDGAYVGSFVHLGQIEASICMSGKILSHEEIIRASKHTVTNGFRHGIELYRDNAPWWDLYRQEFADDFQREEAETASLTHFPTIDPKTPLFKAGQFKSKEAARKHFESLGQSLGKKIEANGDKRIQNPQKLGSDFMKEVYEDMIPLIENGGDPVDRILSIFGIDKSRLDPSATVGDLSYEFIFTKQMTVFARNLNIDVNMLLARLNQNSFPSWFIWRKLDETIKQQVNTRGSNMNDKYIASFAPYVDGIQVDKRIRDLIRQLSNRHELFKDISKKVINTGTYSQLREELTLISDSKSTGSV